jgi:hypothetical protein
MSFRRPRVLKRNANSSPSKPTSTPEQDNPSASSSTLVNVDSLAEERRPYGARDLYIEPERLLYAPGGPFTQPTNPMNRHSSTLQPLPTYVHSASDNHTLVNTVLVTNLAVTDDSGVERVRSQQQKAESYRKWIGDIIPSLVVPYLSLLQRTDSLQQPPNPEWLAEVPPCGHGHSRRQIKVTCVYLDSE